MRTPAKESVFTTLFIAIVILSTIFLIISTLNYVEFFKAMEKLTLTIIKVCPSVGQDGANVTFSFSITNPTRYGALRLRELSFALYFQTNAEDVDVWWERLSYHEPITINPYWNKTFEYLNDPIDCNLEAFQEFYAANHGNVKWLLRCGAIVVTFAGQTDLPLTAEFLSHE